MLNILVAVDGSEGSQRALDAAAKLANASKAAAVTVLFSKELRFPLVALTGLPGVQVEADLPAMQAEMEQVAKRALDKAKDALAKQGVKPALRSAWGPPADIICKTAQDERFDLVVIGHRGLGQMAGALLGSVSDRVVHHSKVPVLVVP